MKKSIPADDLTRIRGIGPARKRWLAEKLQVKTFADLAALDPDQLAQALQAAPLSPRLEEIRQWIDAARELAGGTVAPEAPAAAETAATEAAEPEPPGNGNGDEWQPIATFIVEIQAREDAEGGRRFRTYAYQMDVEAEDTVAEGYWEGIEPEQHCRWMYERMAGLRAGAAATAETEHPSAAEQAAPPGPAPEPPPEAAAAPQTATPPEPAAETATVPPPATAADRVRLALVDIAVEIDGSTRHLSPDNAAAPLSLSRDQRIGLQLAIELQGDDAEALAARQLPLVTTLHINRLDGDDRQTIAGRACHLAPGQTRYTVPLVTALRLPPGHYASWIGVAVPRAGRPLGIATQGPRLIVS